MTPTEPLNSNHYNGIWLGMRWSLTSKHHGFGRFKTRKRFHRTLLEVKRVTNLSLFHVLHPCYYVAHLACIAAQKTSKKAVVLVLLNYIYLYKLHTWNRAKTTGITANVSCTILLQPHWRRPHKNRLNRMDGVNKNHPSLFRLIHFTACSGLSDLKNMSNT